MYEDLNPRSKWEREILDTLCTLLDITNGDAQSIVEAQPHLMAQLWAEGKTPDEAAKIIDEN